MKRKSFPFSAIVGQEKLKTGLLLNAVDPTIGGILVSGHKGTGKSTAVRALAGVLPAIDVVEGCPYNCSPADPENLCVSCAARQRSGEKLKAVRRQMPLVELPLSATEDRVIGTLHVEQILKTGERTFEPGLLAAANRGILYVDEVNLLDDHLVDILLDAAASGINNVEREGISYTHPSQFMLIGTMNPEEGELRPQFLDRFGLSLSVNGVDNASQRSQVVNRRISYDADPDSIIASFADDETLLTGQVRTARSLLLDTSVPEEMVTMAVALSAEARAQGHRAEIGIIKTARALAAFLEAGRVGPEHIIEAARFVLPHRITTLSFATGDQLDEALEDIFKKVLDDEQVPEQGTADTGIDEWEDLDKTVPGANAASHVGMIFTFMAEKKKRSMSRTP